MQTFELPTSESSTQNFGQAARSAAPITVGWLFRRTALWMLIVGLGVAGSCLLYMAASKAETDSAKRLKNNSNHIARAEKS